MILKYSKRIDIYGNHKIIEAKPCCNKMAKSIKEYITEEMINDIIEECPYCKEKIILEEK